MAETPGSEWVLTDWYGSPDGDHVYPKATIRSAEQLRQTLAEYSRQEPRLLNLEWDAQIHLGIALGGPFGAVEVFLFKGQKKSCVALAPVERAKEAVTYVGDWQPSPFPPKHLLPAEEVIRIILSIYQSKELPEWVRWEGE
jgi:hypothetical protein